MFTATVVAIVLCANGAVVKLTPAEIRVGDVAVKWSTLDREALYVADIAEALKARRGAVASAAWPVQVDIDPAVRFEFFKRAIFTAAAAGAAISWRSGNKGPFFFPVGPAPGGKTLPLFIEVRPDAVVMTLGEKKYEPVAPGALGRKLDEVKRTLPDQRVVTLKIGDDVPASLVALIWESCARSRLDYVRFTSIAEAGKSK